MRQGQDATAATDAHRPHRAPARRGRRDQRRVVAVTAGHAIALTGIDEQRHAWADDVSGDHGRTDQRGGPVNPQNATGSS